MKRPLTRKEFLASTTKTVFAVSAGAVAASVIPASGQSLRAGIINAAVAPWPWPYARLDPEVVRKRAHKNNYAGGCAYATFSALVSALAEVVGEPYTLIPPNMMAFGGGGGAGWGTLCGTVNGAAAAVNLCCPQANANALIGELFGWYTTQAFPTDISNDYATARVFLENRYPQAMQQTVSGSVLCHASLSVWAQATKFKTNGIERLERCGRMSGDVAAKAAELLNAFHSGQFRQTFVAPETTTSCMSCHGQTIVDVFPAMKQDCVQCHKGYHHHLYAEPLK